MKKFACALTAVAAVGGGVALAGLANVQTQSAQNDKLAQFKKGAVREAKVLRVTNLMTGEVITQGNLREPGGVVVYDNSNYPPDPNFPNWSLRDINLRPNCDPTLTDPNLAPAFVTLHPRGSDACHEPNTGFDNGALPDLLFCVNHTDNYDLLFEDYFIDPNIPGSWDPNVTGIICATTHDGDYRFQPSPNDPSTGAATTFTEVLGFFDIFDLDGDGIFPATGLYSVDFGVDPTDPNFGPTFRFSLDLSGFAGGGVEAFGAGVFMTDLVNVGADAAPACHYSSPMAGGYVGIAGCTPQTFRSVGGEVAANLWIIQNTTESGFITDPNNPAQRICIGPIDPNIDGQPGLSYTDVWTGGLGINLQWQANSPVGLLRFSHDIPLRFLIPGAANCPGDADGDGDVDIDDLLLVLGNFGTVC